MLVDEDTMAELHVQWMDLPGPDRRPGFPMDELRRRADDEEPEAGRARRHRALPAGRGRRQGAEAGHGTAADELELLLTHGILHLLGYDHAEPDEEAEMFGLQARLLAEWQGVLVGTGS